MADGPARSDSRSSFRSRLGSNSMQHEYKRGHRAKVKTDQDITHQSSSLSSDSAASARMASFSTERLSLILQARQNSTSTLDLPGYSPPFKLQKPAGSTLLTRRHTFNSKQDVPTFDDDDPFEDAQVTPSNALSESTTSEEPPRSPASSQFMRYLSGELDSSPELSPHRRFNSMRNISSISSNSKDSTGSRNNSAASDDSALKDSFNTSDSYNSKHGSQTDTPKKSPDNDVGKPQKKSPSENMLSARGLIRRTSRGRYIPRPKVIPERNHTLLSGSIGDILSEKLKNFGEEYSSSKSNSPVDVAMSEEKASVLCVSVDKTEEAEQLPSPSAASNTDSGISVSTVEDLHLNALKSPNSGAAGEQQTYLRTLHEKIYAQKEDDNLFDKVFSDVTDIEKHKLDISSSSKIHAATDLIKYSNSSGSGVGSHGNFILRSENGKQDGVPMMWGSVVKSDFVDSHKAFDSDSSNNNNIAIKSNHQSTCHTHSVYNVKTQGNVSTPPKLANKSFFVAHKSSDSVQPASSVMSSGRLSHSSSVHHQDTLMAKEKTSVNNFKPPLPEKPSRALHSRSLDLSETAVGHVRLAKIESADMQPVSPACHRTSPSAASRTSDQRVSKLKSGNISHSNNNSAGIDTGDMKDAGAYKNDHNHAIDEPGDEHSLTRSRSQDAKASKPATSNSTTQSIGDTSDSGEFLRLGSFRQRLRMNTSTPHSAWKDTVKTGIDRMDGQEVGSNISSGEGLLSCSNGSMSADLSGTHSDRTVVGISEAKERNEVEGNEGIEVHSDISCAKTGGENTEAQLGTLSKSELDSDSDINHNVRDKHETLLATNNKSRNTLEMIGLAMKPADQIEAVSPNLRKESEALARTPRFQPERSWRRRVGVLATDHVTNKLTDAPQQEQLHADMATRSYKSHQYETQQVVGCEAVVAEPTDTSSVTYNRDSKRNVPTKTGWDTTVKGVQSGSEDGADVKCVAREGSGEDVLEGGDPGSDPKSTALVYDMRANKPVFSKQLTNTVGSKLQHDAVHESSVNSPPSNSFASTPPPHSTTSSSVKKHQRDDGGVLIKKPGGEIVKQSQDTSRISLQPTEHVSTIIAQPCEGNIKGGSHSLRDRKPDAGFTFSKLPHCSEWNNYSEPLQRHCRSVASETVKTGESKTQVSTTVEDKSKSLCRDKLKSSIDKGEIVEYSDSLDDRNCYERPGGVEAKSVDGQNEPHSTLDEDDTGCSVLAQSIRPQSAFIGGLFATLSENSLTGYENVNYSLRPTLPQEDLSDVGSAQLLPADESLQVEDSSPLCRSASAFELTDVYQPGDHKSAADDFPTFHNIHALLDSWNRPKIPLIPNSSRRRSRNSASGPAEPPAPFSESGIHHTETTDSDVSTATHIHLGYHGNQSSGTDNTNYGGSSKSNHRVCPTNKDDTSDVIDRSLPAITGSTRDDWAPQIIDSFSKHDDNVSHSGSDCSTLEGSICTCYVLGGDNSDPYKMEPLSPLWSEFNSENYMVNGYDMDSGKHGYYGGVQVREACEYHRMCRSMGSLDKTDVKCTCELIYGGYDEVTKCGESDHYHDDPAYGSMSSLCDAEQDDSLHDVSMNNVGPDNIMTPLEHSTPHKHASENLTLVAENNHPSVGELRPRHIDNGETPGRCRCCKKRRSVTFADTHELINLNSQKGSHIVGHSVSSMDLRDSERGRTATRSGAEIKPGNHEESDSSMKKSLDTNTWDLFDHIKKQQRQRRDSETNGDDGEEQNGLGSKAGSETNLSIASSRTSRSLWGREVMTDAKPISDAALRSKLHSARSPGTKVTSRCPGKRRSVSLNSRPNYSELSTEDQRILERMLAKREGELKQREQQDAARRAWEAERQRETAARLSAETHRRRLSADAAIRRPGLDIRRSASDVRPASSGGGKRTPLHSRTPSGDQKTWRDLDDWDKMSSFSEKEVDSRLKLLDAEKKRHFGRSWSANAEKILLEKEHKLMERKHQFLERKRSQEQRLHDQQKEMDEFQCQVKDRQEREVRRANSLKEARETEAVMQRKLKNYQAKKKQEERKAELEKQSKLEAENLKAALAVKHKQAESHAKELQDKREHRMRRSSTDLDKKIRLSRQNQQRLDAELDAWHKDLEGYRKLVEQKAEETARHKLEDKRRKAAEERKAKDKLQRDNMKKLLAQEEEWKADLEAQIAMKDARSRLIQVEKEEAMQELRSLAQASQMLRDELKSAYETDEIKTLSQKAELEAKIIGGAGVYSANKNMSSLTLG